MSKRLKIFTKIISVILVVIMFTEACPMNAIAALVADVQGNVAAVENYDESRNFYYDYHSIDVGRAGTLSLNDYTLTPSLSFDALGIDGNVLPVSVSMKYNSPEYRFLKEIMGYTPTAYGNGWLTNYNSMLCELENEDETQLAYISGTGAVMVFAPAETDETLPAGTTKWSIPELEDVYILKVSDEIANADANFAQYTLCTDSATRVFDKFGRLISLVNTSNSATNTIHYVYNDGTNLEDIAEIIDGVGNEYRFTYTDGLLTKIKCYNPDGNAIIIGDGENSAPLEMNFAYTGGNLTTVTFPDGKTTNYDYNSADVMFRAVNIDGYKAEITFSDGYATKLAEFSPNGTEGGYVNIARNENTRTFTDDKGEVQVKTFDENGKILTIVDGDGNYLYGDPEKIEEGVYVIIPEEDASDAYNTICLCIDCMEWDCVCECESEEVCNCIQCKRYSDTTADVHGNVLSEESFDGTKTMKTQNFYTSDGNRLASSVDTSGNVVYYVYDEAGFMQSMTSGDMEVLFDYDAMGNLTKLYQQVSGLSNGYGVGTMSNVYTYENDRISSISHNGFTYSFVYDEWGNQTSVKIGGNVYQSYEYVANNDYRLSKINYANGQSVSYTYDSDDNITGVSYDNGQTYAYVYEYDNDGNLQKIYDNKTGLVTTYSDNAVEIKNASDNSVVYSSVTNEDGTETENVLGYDITYTYNTEYNQITGKTVTSKSFNKNYQNNDNYWLQYDLSVDLSTTTDWFGRVEKKNIDMSILDRVSENTGPHEDSVFFGVQNYTYDDTDTTASTEIKSHSSSYVRNGTEFFSKTEYYEYDASGNITGIYRIENDKKVYYNQYTYDEAGQMQSEYNLLRDEYIIYIYDAGGNIVSKNIYPGCYNGLTYGDDVPDIAYVCSYSDSVWKDKMTGYSVVDPYGNNPTRNYYVSYDAMGNITSFNGSTMTWSAGRQLSTLTTAEDELYSFTYNENGYLSEIEKSVDGTIKYTEYYTWVNDKLVSYRKSWGSYGPIESIILYDDNDEPYGFLLDRDSVYLYNKNLQGDITEIVEPDFGIVGAEYHYDAYGNYICQDPENSYFLENYHSAFVDEANPFTYRGYLDINIGDYHLYYLGSRFYSPQLGRFLNADIHFDTGTGVLGTNMYAYCNNNPVMYVDPTGFFAIPALITIMQVFVDLIQKTGILSLGEAERCLCRLGYIDDCFKLYRFNNKQQGRYIDVAYRTSWQKNGRLKEIRYFVYGEFEKRTVSEWHELISTPLIEQIPLLSNIDEFCNAYPVYAELIKMILDNYVDERISFTWEFITTLMSFYDEIKSGSSNDSILFTKRERYILNILAESGLPEDSNAYIMILMYAEAYHVQSHFLFPMNPVKTITNMFAPY